MANLSREEARQQQQPKYFTGVPCIHGHLAPRYTNNGSCCTCRANVVKAVTEAAAKKEDEHDDAYELELFYIAMNA